MTVVTSYNRNTAMPYVYLTENQEKNKFKRIVTCPPKPILEGHDTCLSKKKKKNIAKGGFEPSTS